MRCPVLSCLSVLCVVQSRPHAVSSPARAGVSTHTAAASAARRPSSSATATQPTRSAGSGSGCGSGPRAVPLQLFLECQSERPSVRHSAQQTDGSEWRQQKAQAGFVPCALPPVSQCDAATATQSDDAAAALWDDGSLDPLLLAVVSKTVLQAAIEVQQEEQWQHTRLTAADYGSRLAADVALVAQMEAGEVKRQHQQADLQAARRAKDQQNQLVSKQLSAVLKSRTIAAQVQKQVEEKVETAYRKQDLVSIQNLLQDGVLSFAVQHHSYQLNARAAIDQCLHI